MLTIHRLIDYGLSQKLITKDDIDYINNRLHHLLLIDKVTPYQATNDTQEDISVIVKPLLDIAHKNGVISENTTTMRDLFESEIMDLFTPLPSTYQQRFEALKSQSPQGATQDFYHRCIATNYIKTARIKKNIAFSAPSPYGRLNITINLSKPEKDPKEIHAALQQSNTDYPLCLLCKENVGFYGNLNHPGRTNHRIIRLSINNEPFYMQYSPYVYYNEHTILLHEKHTPMQVGKHTFYRLFDFVDQFPHYFMGSNAGIPIVGGSILSHEHYQGGRDDFPLFHAKSIKTYIKNTVELSLLHWPLSVVRLKSSDKSALIKTAEALRMYWLDYTLKEAGIIAKTDKPHNAITPIARKENNDYILEIALRNNQTNEHYPDGIFHPHPEHHHIKKENIGLIEVMGLAILPGRLAGDLKQIEALLNKKISSFKGQKIYQNWINALKQHLPKPQLESYLQSQVGEIFIACLEDCGVFKQTPQGKRQFMTFMEDFMTCLR